MDWLKQNMMKNWLIVVLLGLNVLTLSMLWVRMAQTEQPRRREGGTGPQGSLDLMRRMLDLDEKQAERVDSVLAAQREESKEYNDRLAARKRELAEDLFTDLSDTSRASAAAAEIGELQSKVEMIRFRHFQELLTLCTPAQREKLKPIVLEVFGRRPPKEEAGEGKPERRGETAAVVRKPREDRPPADDRPRGPSGGRPAPPSMEEKLARYTQRLHLTAEQAEKVRAVFEKSRKQNEELRAIARPDRGAIDAARERIRTEEDGQIRAILTDVQKRVFDDMISRRRP